MAIPKTYAYGGKTYTQEQLDKLASNANEASKKALDKQFGTSYAGVANGVQITGAPNSPGQNFGQMSEGNVHAAGFEATGQAYSDNLNRLAAEKQQIYDAEAKAKQEKIAALNAQKTQRADARTTELNRISDEQKANAARARSDAEAIVKRQDTIASRAANASVAQAGESGLQMSQGAFEDIKNDTLAKYGTNILNAEQFKASTNMTIDQALQNSGIAIFDKKAAIDTFKDSLGDAELAPVLNALTQASQGNVEAANNVAEYYKKFLDKKAEEEYTRTMAAESRVARDKEWQAAKTPAERYSILKAYAPEIAPYSDIVNQLLANYPGISQDELLGKVAKVMLQSTTAKELYAASVQSGKPLTGKLWDNVASLIGTQGITAMNMTDSSTKKTIEQKRAAQAAIDGQPQGQNPQGTNDGLLEALSGVAPSSTAKYGKADLARLNANQTNEIKAAIKNLPTKEAQLAKTLELMDYYLGGANKAPQAPAPAQPQQQAPRVQEKTINTFELPTADIAILDKQKGNAKAAIEKLRAAFDKTSNAAMRKKINASISYLQQFA